MENNKRFMSSRNRFTIGQVNYFVLNALLSLLLMLLLSEFNYSLWLISFSSVLSLSFFESLSPQGLSRKRRVVIFIFTMCVISVAYIIVQKWRNQLSLFLILLYFVEQFIGSFGGVYFTYLLNKSE
jgi:hypothetical protein